MHCLSGWGSTGEEGISTDQLQETVVPIVESSQCLAGNNASESVDEDLIVCTGAGPCKVIYFHRAHVFARLSQGDSGGPLTMVNEDGGHALLGIVSKRLGHNCSSDGLTIFTRVSTLLPWIDTSIKENGGMASCDFTLSALPTLGIFSWIWKQVPELLVECSYTDSHKKGNDIHLKLCRVADGAPLPTGSSDPGRTVDGWTPYVPRKFWVRQLLYSSVT